MPKAHITTERARAVESIRCALVGLRRLFQRRELAEVWAAAAGRGATLDYTELRLLDAVRVSQADARPGATVGDVARRLGIDPSRASRLVARGVAAGLLERHAEPGDGRKVVVRVTRRGAALQEQGSDLTRARIALAVAGWRATDRARFAALFDRFAEAMLAEPVSSGSGAARSARRRAATAA